MSQPLAYKFSGMVFCADCAYMSTKAAFDLVNVIFPGLYGESVTDTMEDMIAALMLKQAVLGEEDGDHPVPYTEAHVCENSMCGKQIPAIEEAA